jgi:very-short-patch-repair endonuclease
MKPAAPPKTSNIALHRARKLRANMTDAERKLWFALRDRRFADFKFRRQAPLGRFFVDFLCYDARLVIEVDGGQHSGSASDIGRDEWLRANAFRILRFWNNDVLGNLDGVLTTILAALTEMLPHPARAMRAIPSPAGEEGIEPAAPSPREARESEHR